MTAARSARVERRGRRSVLVMEWGLDNAEAVAQVFHDAAVNHRGKVVDHGFFEDARSIWEAVDRYEEDEAAGAEGTGIRVAVVMRDHSDS